MTPTLVLLNPHAGGGRAGRLRQPLEQWLAQHAPQVQLATPDTAQLARDRLQRLPAHSRVVVVGGDGTLNQLLAPLLLGQHTLGLVPC
ncbi:MAG: diacylglycerol kinase family protein, partial [Betaproteobacteria bacterium]